MKKLIILAAFVGLAATSCKKLSIGCYVCRENTTGNDLSEMCGKTQIEIDKMARDRNWTCYKQ